MFSLKELQTGTYLRVSLKHFGWAQSYSVLLFILILLFFTNSWYEGGKSVSDSHLFNVFGAKICTLQFYKKKRDKLKSINLSLFLKLDVGNVLSSQEVALQVFSPLQVFTTVFGMGTGGLPAIGHQQTCRLLLPIILGFSYTLKIA